jgi:multidrug efflux pump subunit AcrB
MLGQHATTIVQGDRVISVRVRVEDQQVGSLERLLALPLRTAQGSLIMLSQVADVAFEEGQLELHREDLRQLVAVTGDLEGRDTGSAISAIKRRLAKETQLPAGVVEFGGLFEQQQTAFHNLMIVLALGTALVFTVLLFEFRSFVEPIAIVVGALSALFGTMVALWLTQTSLNIVSFLGAIIGVGIVAKNGILMLDLVGHLQEQGLDSRHALARSARRRLRPILMTTLSTILAMVPTAWGIGHGADMLRPLAIGIIGALCTSMVFSLLVTPTMHYVLGRLSGR